MRAILSNLTVVFLQKDGARMLYRLKTALPSKGPKMSHSFVEEMPSTLHPPPLPPLRRTNIPPNEQLHHLPHYWIMHSERSVALLGFHYVFLRIPTVWSVPISDLSRIYLTWLSCMCSVPLVKLKYIYREGCKIGRTVVGGIGGGWTNSSCYVIFSEHD